MTSKKGNLRIKQFNLHFLGRFGNCMFQYAFARAFCERHGHELRTDPWPAGEALFDLPAHPRCELTDPLHSEFNDLEKLAEDQAISWRSYCQQQKCLDLYTRTQVRRWFQYRPEVLGKLAGTEVGFPNIAHLRRGDYGGYGYVVVSQESYAEAARRLGLDEIYFLSEENAEHRLQPLGGELPFAADFYRLTQARVLLRSNSTFAWWAATLAPDTQQIYSPLIEGVEGGVKERACLFVSGNWPRFAGLQFTTDLHLNP